tara:strand:+ start:123 stop:944 length:822 start_codon:yes stop_codon:yes gene_type:complete
MQVIFLTFVLALGASIGSFINVVIWRLPKNESIVTPRSYCPKCKKTIRFFDNVPILSYILLNGKCRSCKENIKINYFVIELLTALIFIVVYFSKNTIFFKLDFGYFIFISFLLFTILIIQFLLDINYYWLPTKITNLGIFLGIIITLSYSLFFYNLLFFNHVIAGFLGLMIFFLVYKIGSFLYKKDVLGTGDIRLIFMMGIWLGIEGILLTIYLSFLSAGLYSSFLILTKKIKRNNIIPFGPFIILSGSSIWLLGTEFYKSLYLNLVSFLYSF